MKEKSFCYTELAAFQSPLVQDFECLTFWCRESVHNLSN